MVRLIERLMRLRGFSEERIRDYVIQSGKSLFPKELLENTDSSFGFSILGPDFINRALLLDQKGVILPENFTERALDFLNLNWSQFRSEYTPNNSQRAQKNKSPFVVSLSGGIDSITMLAAAVEAVGAEHVLALHFYHDRMGETEKTDYWATRRILEKYKCDSRFIDLSSFITAKEKELRRTRRFKSDSSSFACSLAEHIVRLRTSEKADMIFKTGGGITLDSSNLTEICIGNITAGVSIGMVSIFEDLLKCEVIKFAEELGVPQWAIEQEKRTGEFGLTVKEMFGGVDYTVLDPLIHIYISSEKPYEDAINLGHDPDWTRKIVDRMHLTFLRLYTAGSPSNYRDYYGVDLNNKVNGLEGLIPPWCLTMRDYMNDGTPFHNALIERRNGYLPR